MSNIVAVVGAVADTGPPKMAVTNISSWTTCGVFTVRSHADNLAKVPHQIPTADCGTIRQMRLGHLQLLLPLILLPPLLGLLPRTSRPQLFRNLLQATLVADWWVVFVSVSLRLPPISFCSWWSAVPTG